jgi:hypothetical protein
MQGKTKWQEALVTLIRDEIRLRHRLAANEEIAAVRTDPVAVHRIRRRHRAAGDAEIAKLTPVALKRQSDVSGAWQPESLEQVLAACAMSRREWWEVTGKWDGQVAFWKSAGLPEHATMRDFADSPGVVVDVPPLPEDVAEVLEREKTCRRGHVYSTDGAPSWLGSRCPTCRSASKLAYAAAKLKAATS